MEYTKREYKYLIIAIIVLTLVFGFNDGKETFELSYWLANLVKVFIIVAFSVFVHDFAHDLMAKKYGFLSEFRLLGIKGFYKKNPFPKTFNLFGKELKIRSFPIGIVIALLITLASNGLIFFTAISCYGLVILKHYRFGKKFIEVTDFEEAKVAVAGPLSNILIALIFSAFNVNSLFDTVVMVNAWMAFWDILPLPGLDGAKVYIGSRPLFVFSFVLIIGLVILVRLAHVSSFLSLILAFAMSITLLISYLFSKARQ